MPPIKPSRDNHLDVLPATPADSSQTVEIWEPEDSPFSAERLQRRYQGLEHYVTDRRQFNKLMLASLGASGLPAALAGCAKESAEEIVPYVRSPESVVPGVPTYYSSVVTRDGYGYGVIVESHQGRPTKIEGNPAHPASRGGSDIFMQAELLNLYDPDRSGVITEGGRATSQEHLLRQLTEKRDEWFANEGRGLHILTPLISSPTLADQIDTFQRRYPEAHWHQWQAVNHDNAVRAANHTFGRNVVADFNLVDVDVLVQFDGDLLTELPGSLAYARDFAGRRAPSKSMSQVFALESRPGLIGAVADHRLALRADRVETLVRRLAAAFDGPHSSPAPIDETGLSKGEAHWLARCIAALQGSRRRCLVVAGISQPPAVHSLVHWLNFQLGNCGNTVLYRPSPIHRPEPMNDSLKALVEAMDKSEVDSLLILDCNPAYDAPRDWRFAEKMTSIPFRLHVGSYADETAAKCHWHVPLSHILESWSDARAFDGTVAVQQPLLRPMSNSVSLHSLFALLNGEGRISDYDCLRRHWMQGAGAKLSEQDWRRTLINGVLEGSATPPVEVYPASNLPSVIPDERLPGGRGEVGGPLLLQFAPDPRVGDGRYANNGWLQELPDPLSKHTWGNALLIAPGLAERYAVATGDVVRVADGSESIEMPVRVMPEHAEGAATVYLGGGRDVAMGRDEPPISRDVGVNTYPLRLAAHPFWRGGIRLEPTGRNESLAFTQHHDSMEGRDPVRESTLANYRAKPDFIASDAGAHSPAASLYPEPTPEPFARSGGYDWAMSIDLNACIGCGTCTVACQAENNIPVVGREQVLAGREMHWIRIDRYYHGSGDQLRTLMQPMPCQHCENAPCEYVCPVGATVHDSEGLNVMVYNRCIGTRDCSQNCPYKVRRFNFLDYNYSDVRSQALAPLRNPDVTVRSRGVMEKCTYCVQRISEARRHARKEGREIREGEVVTACQAACPTRAITFGDLNNEHGALTRARAHPLSYSVLAELNTRPRTTYLARIRNEAAPVDTNDDTEAQ